MIFRYYQSKYKEAYEDYKAAHNLNPQDASVNEMISQFESMGSTASAAASAAAKMSEDSDANTQDELQVVVLFLYGKKIFFYIFIYIFLPILNC